MTDTSVSVKTSSATPGIYTVPPQAAFLSTLAQDLMQKALKGGLTLADYTIVVPDDETAKQLRQAFLAADKGQARLIPHIFPLSSLEEEALGLKVHDNPVLSQALLDLPPPIPRLRRQLLLAQEVLKIPGMASSPEKAVKLGGELGKFLDEAQQYQVDLTQLDQLVPPAYRAEWEKTAAFLKIITEIWPRKLQEMGMSDPEMHRSALLRIQAAHWRERGAPGPVIAAGFVSATPAAADFLKAILSLPQGQIILPGLDITLDDASWDAITPVHPQFALKSLLTLMGVTRTQVSLWDSKQSVGVREANILQARTDLLRETMRPFGVVIPASAEKKKPAKGKKKAGNATGFDKRATAGLDLITCGSQQEEASVIALRLREVLETPARTGMLVTADRNLARRVAARLRRWGVHVQSDQGQTLAETSIGIFLLAAANMAAEEWAPVPLLETLKHPLAALGESEAAFRAQVEEIEDLALHGSRPGPGAKGLRAGLRAAYNRAARKPAPWLQQFVDKIEDAGQPFFEMMKKTTPQSFSEILDAHIRFVELLANGCDVAGDKKLWQGDEGQCMARFLRGLRAMAQFVPDVTGSGYVDVLRGLMREMKAPVPPPSHPALVITTPQRARLLKSDVIILGGLNAESWPAQVNENPWLSQDMMKSLGLSAVDASIGNSAHAFVQLTCAPDVLMTRAMRTSGIPTVASPFLMRLMMALRGAGLEDEIESKSRLLDIHREMHTPPHVTPIEPPAPTPPVENRPKQLPATAIETLRRDPYAVYVRYILKLKGKPPLDAPPSQAERGRFVHEALDSFMKKYPKDLPPDAEADLLKIGDEIFRERMGVPSVRAFWWPRFERVAKWFVTFERERRKTCATLGTEVRGKLQIDMGDGTTFTLTAIADRIDRAEDGKLNIIDYKTGSIPQPKQVTLGFSPQLTLEALIAFTGGFDKVDAADVSSLQYWKLSGGRPGGKISVVNADIKTLVNEARAGLESVLKTFNKQSTPYLVQPHPGFEPRYDNTNHLSRIGEWSQVKKVRRRKTAVKAKTPAKHNKKRK